MMNEANAHPETPAIEMLRKHGVAFRPHLFTYQEKGGTTVSSQALSVSEHAVVKTLIFQTEKKQPLIVLMHGDRRVSTKDLALQMGAKKISAASPEMAQECSGYLVGGTSPFGVKTEMPVYLEASVLEIDVIYINGGQRGFLVEIASKELVRVLHPTLVRVGQPFESKA